MNWCAVTTTNSCASSSNIVRHQVALHLIVSYMKTVLSLLIAGFLATACTTQRAQLVTIQGSNLKSVPDQGLVLDNDTMTLRYSFSQERGQMTILLINKLSRPLYVDWKRSAFIIGKKKLDYWYDVADVDLKTTAFISWYGRYLIGSVDGVVSKDDPVGFIPPGTQLAKQQFLVYPHGTIRLPGQPKVVEEAPKSANRKKPVAVDIYTYQPDLSPLQFRNYLTLSTDKDFKTDFSVDTKFWASDIRVLPVNQLTDVVVRQYDGGRYYDPLPFNKPDSFYIKIPIQ